MWETSMLQLLPRMGHREHVNPHILPGTISFQVPEDQRESSFLEPEGKGRVWEKAGVMVIPKFISYLEPMSLAKNMAGLCCH